jgi:hypothetical protein
MNEPIETTNLIDYAMPMMKIEKMLREIHDFCLENDYASAYPLCAFIAVESRVLSASLAIMENKRK